MHLPNMLKEYMKRRFILEFHEEDKGKSFERRELQAHQDGLWLAEAGRYGWEISIKIGRYLARSVNATKTIDRRKSKMMVEPYLMICEDCEVAQNMSQGHQDFPRELGASLMWPSNVEIYTWSYPAHWRRCH
jgi:hypothetical protein